MKSGPSGAVIKRASVEGTSVIGGRSIVEPGVGFAVAAVDAAVGVGAAGVTGMVADGTSALVGAI
jgi:hypothetical protein